MNTSVNIVDVYAVIDLYGTCAGITMTSNTGIYDSQRLSVRQKYTTNTHLHATAGSAGGAGATSASSFSKHQHNSQQKLLSGEKCDTKYSYLKYATDYIPFLLYKSCYDS